MPKVVGEGRVPQIIHRTSLSPQLCEEQKRPVLRVLPGVGTLLQHAQVLSRAPLSGNPLQVCVYCLKALKKAEHFFTQMLLIYFDSFLVFNNFIII